ncbi:MAG: hypothetical protein V4584_05620 [Verrucomicrobiota bacterium]
MISREIMRLFHACDGGFHPPRCRENVLHFLTNTLRRKPPAAGRHSVKINEFFQISAQGRFPNDHGKNSTPLDLQPDPASHRREP